MKYNKRELFVLSNHLCLFYQRILRYSSTCCNFIMDLSPVVLKYCLTPIDTWCHIFQVEEVCKFSLHVVT